MKCLEHMQNFNFEELTIIIIKFRFLTLLPQRQSNMRLFKVSQILQNSICLIPYLEDIGLWLR
ncbi:hypothetical protein pb186bvf_014751 [Paramecium bursaria]